MKLFFILSSIAYMAAWWPLFYFSTHSGTKAVCATLSTVGLWASYSMFFWACVYCIQVMQHSFESTETSNQKELPTKIVIMILLVPLTCCGIWFRYVPEARGLTDRVEVDMDITAIRNWMSSLEVPKYHEIDEFSIFPGRHNSFLPSNENERSRAERIIQANVPSFIRELSPSVISLYFNDGKVFEAEFKWLGWTRYRRGVVVLDSGDYAPTDTYHKRYFRMKEGVYVYLESDTTHYHWDGLQSRTEGMKIDSSARVMAEVERTIKNNEDLNALKYDRDNYAQLYKASHYGNVEALQLLLDHGANVNVQSEVGETPLSEAARMGHLEVVEMLLEHGAKAHLGTYHEPLHRAAGVNYPDIVKLLLEHGVAPDSLDANGDTAIIRAASNNSAEAAEILIACGADVNFRHGTDRYTPLHLAATSGAVEMVNLLLAKGADVHARDRDGKTPLDEALYISSDPWFRGRVDKSDLKEVIKILQDHSTKGK